MYEKQKMNKKTNEKKDFCGKKIFPQKTSGLIGFDSRCQ